MECSVEIIIQPDGSILVPRGSQAENDIVRHVLNDAKDKPSLEMFFSVSEHSILLVGDRFYCG